MAQDGWAWCKGITCKKASSGKLSFLPAQTQVMRSGPQLLSGGRDKTVQQALGFAAVKRLCAVHESDAPKCGSWALWRESPLKRDETGICYHAQMPGCLFSVWTTNCNINLDYSWIQPHGRSIWVFSFLSGTLKLSFLTPIGLWLWNPPRRASGSVPVRFIYRHD